MRLGLLGPAGTDIAGLGRAAEFLLNGARVHRAVYLGNDGALDRAVEAWAQKLVGGDPSDEAAWRRAAELAAHATAEAIDRFVTTERARLRLKALEALPGAGVKALETVGGQVAALMHDEAELTDHDRARASLIVFGRGDGPVVREVDARWLVSPGPIGARGGGLAVLEETDGEITVTIFDATGTPTRREALRSSAPRPARQP